MEIKEKNFKIQSEKFGFDREYRNTIKHNINQYEKAVDKGLKFYSSLEKAQSKASEIKDYTLDNLDQLLIKFEKNAIQNNIQVLWAGNIKQAIDHIMGIVEEEEAELIVKTKSMISEELELNKVLEEK